MIHGRNLANPVEKATPKVAASSYGPASTNDLAARLVRIETESLWEFLCNRLGSRLGSRMIRPHSLEW
jgi:hypothetical protein